MSKKVKIRADIDMTQGSPIKHILLFALPIGIGNILQQMYVVVGTVAVGRFVGPQALAAVGASSAAYSFIQFLIMGLTLGASVVISQAFGSNEKLRLKQAYFSSSFVIIVAGILFSVVGVVVAKPLLLLLGTPDNVINDASAYLIILCIGLLPTTLYNGMSAFLRAIGDSVIPLVALIISSLLNIVLVLYFVLVLQSGVRGVALATVIAQAVSAIFCIVYLNKNEPELHSGLRRFKPDWLIVREVLRFGIPAAFSTSVVIFSAMLIQRSVNQFGSDVMAAFTASQRTEQICLGISFAIATSVGTFCGQNYGAKRLDRVISGLHAGFKINVIYSMAVTAFLLLAARWLVSMFVTDPQVIEIGAHIVRITACFVMVLGFLFIYQHFLRNVSDIRPTVWMSFVEIGARGILPIIFAAIWGYAGIWWATPIGWAGALLIGHLRYKSGKWKKEIERQIVYE